MRLIATLLTLLFVTPAKAAPLPEGEFILSGALTSLIQEGLIVPVYVHLKTAGDRMDWTFVTIFEPDPEYCKVWDKCQRRQQTLSHRVAWGEDGTLTVKDTSLAQGPGLVIDRADADLMIYTVIQALVSGGTLVLDESGGTLTKTLRRGPKHTVTLCPGDLDLLDQAMMAGVGLQMSMSRLNHCALRQILTIAAKDTRSETEQVILDATDFMLFQQRLVNETLKMEWKHGDDIDAPDLVDATMRDGIVKFAFATVVSDVAEALLAGDPLSDDAIVDAAKDGVAGFLEQADAGQYESFTNTLFTERRTGYLAAIRYVGRYVALLENGDDPEQVICKDVTLRLRH